jgi:ParB family chromosome partitioning protein
MESLEQVGVKELKPSPFNPRTNFDAAKLQELADSIGTQGIIEPIIGRRVNGHVEIIAGERRWRAAKLAKLPTVPVLVRDMTDGQALEAQLVENEQREDVDELDQAAGFKRLMDLDATTYTAEYLATRLGLKPASVYLRLKLLALIPDAKELLRLGTITAGHGVLIARLNLTDQAAVLKWIKETSWNGTPSVRQLKQHINSQYRKDLFSDELATEQPKVAKRLADLKAKGVEVVQLSANYSVQERDKKAGVLSGQDYREVGKKKCDNIQVGAVVLGGQDDDVKLMDVCTNKKCKVHFPEAVRAAAQQRKAAKAATESPAAKEKRLAAEKAEKRKREIDEATRGLVLSAILKTVKAPSKEVLVQLVGAQLDSTGSAQFQDELKALGLADVFDGKTWGQQLEAKMLKATDRQVAQLAVFSILAEEIHHADLAKLGKRWGVDVKQLQKGVLAASAEVQERPLPKGKGKAPAAAAKPKAAAKKKAAKKK